MNILFLCTGNSCRSQMAEGWGKQLAPADWIISSAGIQPHGKNPRAIKVTAEAVIDISNQESTRVIDEMLKQADLVITVCGHADNHCPVLPAGTRKEHWPIDDPAKAGGTDEEILNVFRATRDEIRLRVMDLIDNEATDNKAQRHEHAMRNI